MASIAGSSFAIPAWVAHNDVAHVQGLAASVTQTGGDIPAYPALSESLSLIGVGRYQTDPQFVGADGSGYSMVIVDTGADLDHPFFGPDTDSNGVADKIVYQHDFADNDNDASDVVGHGTNVASIAASVAPGASLIILKVFTSLGNAGTFGMIENALSWVAANAATYNIASVNMSLGDGSNSAASSVFGVLNDELQVLDALGITAVSAAGNFFYNYGGAQGQAYPASDPYSLSVGAVFDGDNGTIDWDQPTDFSSGADRLTSFSQRHQRSTDIFAPGAIIDGATLDGGIAPGSGTSQAAPHVTGAVTLAQQIAEQTLGHRLDVQEMSLLLQATGVHILDGDDEDDNVRNTDQLYRRLDIVAMAQAIDDIIVTDAGSNDTIATATPLTTLGTGAGKFHTNFVSSTLHTQSDPIDYFAVNLAAGDVLGVNSALSGFTHMLTVLDSANGIVRQTTQAINRSSSDPSPILDYGVSSSFQASTAGTYYVGISAVPETPPRSGTYTMNIQVERPALESEAYGTSQILFLDFDGATIDRTTFSIFNSLQGTATLSPLSSFLTAWGLSSTQENALIDAIIAEVTENLSGDVIAQGSTYNGNFGTSSIPGAFNLEIRNSRDHGDLFGLPNVTRVIIGGTRAEMGYSPIAPSVGLAESYDVGNFDREDSAFVLLDLLSRPSGSGTLNGVTLASGASKLDLVATAVGNIASHEAGHLFGVLDTIPSNFLGTGSPRSLSDAFIDIPGTFGLMDALGQVGSQWGDNEVDMDFVTDTIYPQLPGVNYPPGGFAATGTQNPIGTLSYGLSTGTQLTVSTLVDELDSNYSAGDLSLREALALANAGSRRETIQFDPGLFASGPATITLTSALSQLVVASDVDIAGPGASQLTINRSGDPFRIIQVNAGVEATISGLTISGGNSVGWGGSVGGGLLNLGDLTLEGVVVASSQSSLGGGIAQLGAAASLRIIDSTIRNNSTATGAGGIYATGGTLEIVSSTISQNSGSLYAGGIYLLGSASSPVSLSMVNSTISSNTRSGLSVAGGSYATAEVLNSTVTLNSGDIYFIGTEGGGIKSSGVVTLHNTIVAGNSDGDIKGSFMAGSSYNLIGDVRSAVNLVHGTNGNMVGTQASPINAYLATLGSYGGATKTHALLTTSPALNAGSSALSASLAFDQRGEGFARISGTAVDIGAVEGTSGSLLTVDTLLDESDGNYGAGDLSLREALALAQTIPAADTITFAPSLSASGPATIMVTYDGPDSGTVPDPLVIATDVTIDGPGADRLTINANGSSLGLSIIGTPFFAATIRGVTLTGSTGHGILKGGGSSADVLLDQVEIVGNGGNGVRFGPGGALVITDSTIVGNLSTGIDGTVNNNVTIINTTVSGNNSSTFTGGVALSGGTLINVTITNNRAQTAGSTSAGGLFAQSSSGGTGVVLVENSIIAGNFEGTGTAADDLGRTTGTFPGTFSSNSSHNLVGTFGNSGLSTSTNITTSNPGLTTLGDNGGPTRTHMLLNSSPAIDAGDDAVAEGLGLLRDQRGERRIANGNTDQTAQVDIGAVESTGEFLIVSTSADENDTNYSPGDLSLREALGLAANQHGVETILFHPTLYGGAITLSLGELGISTNLKIEGPDANLLTVSGNNTSRVFRANSGTTASIRDLRIADGYTTGGNYGAGIESVGTLLSLDRVAIENNVAQIAGGGIYATGGSLTITNSTIADNDAGYQGGGIFLLTAQETSITNTTISSNSAYYVGGGIYTFQTDVTLAHSTVTQNRAEYGGGLYNYFSSVVAHHSIIADNFNYAGSIENDIYGALDAAFSRYNLIGTGGSGGLTHGVNGNLVGVANPGLTSLGFNGGPTRTHALLDGSVAIDAGDLAILDAPFADQRGRRRIDDGNHDNQARIDIGAFELAVFEFFGSV